MRLLFALLLMLMSTAAAVAERRVALIIAEDGYRLVRPLANPVHDGEAMAAALKKLGFEVILETNRDLRRMRRALDDFRLDAKGADVALVYFSGHGVEISGDNRLLPIDADASSLDALEKTSLPLEEVRDSVAATAKVGLIMLDACRSDPFSGSSGEGRGATSLAKDVSDKVKPGLGRIGRAENILFAFSAAPGETAADGTGQNSPFTTALTKYLGTDGLEIRSVLTLVQQEVYDL
ncbi:caspase family protein, partial [Mesorhizobium sp. M7A.F.Ca.CA.004.02.1.1]